MRERVVLVFLTDRAEIWVVLSDDAFVALLHDKPIAVDASMREHPDVQHRGVPLSIVISRQPSLPDTVLTQLPPDQPVAHLFVSDEHARRLAAKETVRFQASQASHLAALGHLDPQVILVRGGPATEIQARAMEAGRHNPNVIVRMDREP